jgi:uncharacterized protein
LINPSLLPGMPLPSFISPTSEGVVLRLHTHPGAKKTGWVGWYGEKPKLLVQSPPVEGAANQACIQFLARTFKIKKSEVILLAGGKSRSKTFLLKGLTLEKCLGLIPDQNPDPSNS